MLVSHQTLRTRVANGGRMRQEHSFCFEEPKQASSQPFGRAGETGSSCRDLAQLRLAQLRSSSVRYALVPCHVTCLALAPCHIISTQSCTLLLLLCTLVQFAVLSDWFEHTTNRARALRSSAAPGRRLSFRWPALPSCGALRPRPSPSFVLCVCLCLCVCVCLNPV
jgi:hypothetical protein